MKLRFGVLGDRKALEALQLRASLVWDEYREALLAHPEVIELPDAQLHDGFVRVAELDDRPVGFSVLLPTEAERVYELDGLFVEPDLQRAGVGRALVEDLDLFTPADAVIEVTANPRAEEFYRKLGFVTIGSAETQFGPALRMRRDRVRR